MPVQLDILARERFLALGLCLALVSAIGCARQVPGPGQRLATAQTVSGQSPGFEQARFRGGAFDLFGFQAVSDRCRGRVLHLYIEGDGLAFVTRSRVSEDPTPLHPVALGLAALDPWPCKIYLARPCQYISGPGCKPSVWTARRFSPEVIQAYDTVLDRIAARYQPAAYTLYGFSGGGAVAAILAAQRQDVSTLVTVAGNLDTAFWTRARGISSLTGSLNPAEFTGELAEKNQYHFIGGRDRIVGEDVFSAFARRFAAEKNFHFKVLDGFDHSSCWEEAWPDILKEIEEQ